MGVWYRAVFVGVAAIALLGIAFVQLPADIKAPCRISACAEWHLSAPGGGRFTVETISRRPPTGIRQSSVFQFDRQDFVAYECAEGVSTGSTVERGQPLGRIRSVDTEGLLQETLEQIRAAEADVALLGAGSKEELVAQARWEAKGAASSAELAKAELDRKNALFEKGLISKEEMDLAEATSELADISCKAAEAGLAATEAGERDEARQSAFHVLEALRRRAESLTEKIGSLEIKAPFSGEIVARPDTTLVVSLFKTDTMAVEMAVGEWDIWKIKPGQEMAVRLRTSQVIELPGRVATVGSDRRFVAGQNRFVVVALIPNGDGILRQGTAGEAVIACERLPIRTVIARYLSDGLWRFR